MTIDHPDHAPYKRFTSPQRVDKAVLTLEGMLRGVTLDGELNAAEIHEVQNWCNDYRDLLDKAPFKELIPTLEAIQQDGKIDPDEQEDLIWMCRNLAGGVEYFDYLTHGIQTLQGLLHGIMADNHISEEEARGLQGWVDDHFHLKGCYPYDEIDALLTDVLRDGAIDQEEQKTLKSFFSEFVRFSFSKRVRDEGERVKDKRPSEITLPGVCAVCPDIVFESKTFTFTGPSPKVTRSQIEDIVTKLAGKFSRSLLRTTDYLVVGKGSNPCWAYSCYGRKVEKAVQMRRDGHPLAIVHENDFWDAVEDMS
jgi:hypothetical protein